MFGMLLGQMGRYLTFGPQCEYWCLPVVNGGGKLLLDW